MSSGLGNCVGRLYTLCLLYNLNLRRRTAKSIFGSDGMADTSSADDKSSASRRGPFGSRIFGSASRTARANCTMELQVSVHQEELTTVEEGRVRVVTFNDPVGLVALRSARTCADQGHRRTPWRISTTGTSTAQLKKRTVCELGQESEIAL